MKQLWLFVLLIVSSVSFATIHPVNVNALSFSPANLTVQQGDTVRWIKTGGFHNVSEVSNPSVFRSGEPTGSAFTYDFAFNAPLSGTYNYECEVHAGSGMVGTVTVEAGGSPPDAPTYLGPMNGATDLATSGSLQWNTALGADHYIVRLGTSNPPAIVDADFNGTSYDYSGLSNGTQYFWQIISENDFGTADGNVWSFTTIDPLPGQANSPFPVDTATNVPITTFLGWDPADFADSYEVFIGTAEPLTSLGTTTETTITPTAALIHSTSYLWRVNSTNGAGTTTGATWHFTTEAGSAVGDRPIPTAFELGAAYPNPFNSNVRISLSIPTESFALARVYAITGREVATLLTALMSAGAHDLEWNAAGQSAGLYFLKCECAGLTQTQKLIYLP
ncbi:MAG: T9SS type A sorting domain-containing protein [bacterium]|nr:T9SS type A sorting domain-containing protein [bacterium]